MSTFNVAEPQVSEGKEFVPLATGEYPMIIKEASIGPSMYANDRGEFPEMVSITWQLDGTKSEQAEWEELGYYPDQRVYQRVSSFFGMTKSGNPSKFYGMIQDFVEQGLLTPEFEIDDLVGIRQRVLVERYTKQQGVNAGQPGNRVLAVTAPKKNGSKAPESPSVNVSASQAMTRSTKPNLTDADDIEGLTIPEDLPQLNGMDTAGVRAYAKTLAKEAGGRFADRDYDSMRPSVLIGAIRSMHTVLAPVENDELF